MFAPLRVGSEIQKRNPPNWQSFRLSLILFVEGSGQSKGVLMDNGKC
jgi:hypothetical protein